MVGWFFWRWWEGVKRLLINFLYAININTYVLQSEWLFTLIFINLKSDNNSSIDYIIVTFDYHAFICQENLLNFF